MSRYVYEHSGLHVEVERFDVMWILSESLFQMFGDVLAQELLLT